mmetsp:Transcript_8233/g.24719  ORF Transcript_8233/g.24719 Transcript_8233/m.24719 type:complete len:142 (+) Transcript_8233:318-743(+)
MRASYLLFAAFAVGIESGADAFAVRPSLVPRKSASASAAAGLSMSRSADDGFSLLGKGAGEDPRRVGKGGTFLGIRRESGYLRRAMNDPKGLRSTEGGVTPLMPLGGLSPCVIKVLGVGGGGSNAVSSLCLCDRERCWART